MALTRRTGLALLAPMTAVLLATLVVPAGTFFVYSFFDFELLEPQAGFHLEHYETALTEAAYRRLGWSTLQIALPTTVLAVAGGFCLAYYLALTTGRWRTVLLALIVTSMLASYLARIYAWRTLLGEQGMLAGLIAWTGLGDGAPDFLLFSRASVVIGQANFLLPFTTLVLFAGLSGISPQLRASGRDLGARASTVFFRVTLPLAGPALLSAIVFSFFLSAGDYLTPAMLGGADGSTIGSAISDQLKVTGNYPLGAALSFVVLALFSITYGAVRLGMRALGALPDEARMASR